jgi:hemerythrin
MQWSEAFATGVDRLDEQHKLLFKMTGDFRAALDEGRGQRVYGTLLVALDTYARSHFRFEESCMERYRCAVAAANTKAHEGFVTLLNDYRARYEARGFDPTEARTLIDTLDQWLESHIGRIDVQLRESVPKGL